MNIKTIIATITVAIIGMVVLCTAIASQAETFAKVSAHNADAQSILDQLTR